MPVPMLEILKADIGVPLILKIVLKIWRELENGFGVTLEHHPQELENAKYPLSTKVLPTMHALLLIIIPCRAILKKKLDLGDFVNK